jgi:tetratricopeptide (TPR) repeat protein
LEGVLLIRFRFPIQTGSLAAVLLLSPGFVSAQETTSDVPVNAPTDRFYKPTPAKPTGAMADPKATNSDWWLELAHEQAKAGSTREERSKMYIRLCAAAVRARRFDLVPDWIARANEYERQLAWGQVAREYAIQGKPTEAYDAIGHMTDAAIRDRALVDVVISLAKADLTAQAQSGFGLIYDRRLLSATKNSEAGVRAMQLALEGSPEAAIEVLKQSETPERQVGALRRIVWWVGRQNQSSRALPFLAMVQDSHVRDMLLSGLAEGLAEAGNVTEALDRTDSINDKSVQAYSYAQVAETLARSNKKAEAREALGKALEIEPTLEPGLLRSLARLRLAEAYAVLGELPRAREIWKQVYDDPDHDVSWLQARDEYLAKSNLDAGDLDSAWTIALRTGGETRFELLELIAEEMVSKNQQEALLEKLRAQPLLRDRFALSVGAIHAFFPVKEFQGKPLRPMPVNQATKPNNAKPGKPAAKAPPAKKPPARPAQGKQQQDRQSGNAGGKESASGDQKSDI